jgi:hypothetical protein
MLYRLLDCIPYAETYYAVPAPILTVYLMQNLLCSTGSYTDGVPYAELTLRCENYTKLISL